MPTHRERVLAAFAHRSPDRLPVDISGTGATQINFDAYARLKEHLGIDPRPATFYSRRSHLATIDEEVLERLDVDCRGIRPSGPVNRPVGELPDGSYLSDWGDVWVKPGDGLHYVRDAVINGDLTADAIQAYNWPDPDDPGYVQGLKERAQTMHEETDYFVILNLPVGFGNQAQFLRGYDQWMVDLAGDPVGADLLADAVLDVWIAISRRMLQACGPYIDGVYYAEDLAFQHGPMMRHKMFVSYFKPRLRRILDMIREETGAKIIFHSCGSVVTLVPDLIDIGIDALNPVQVSAIDMDTAYLKREYGRDITFWGGIDTQHVLPFGTPDDVRQEVKRRVGDLADGGGYVLGSVHNIQAEVPPENVMAMVQAARDL
jgi:uroporphyrinogen decarboxylase